MKSAADSRRRHIVRAVSEAPPTNMSAFTVSAVAAPGAAKFASRNANSRRPVAAPARVVRRAGRVARQVVAKAGPSGEVKKVRATTRSGNVAIRPKTRRSRTTPHHRDAGRPYRCDGDGALDFEPRQTRSRLRCLFSSDVPQP